MKIDRIGNPATIAGIRNQPGIAVVGARKPESHAPLVATAVGEIIAAKQGILISGNAPGCDQLAQDGALGNNGRVISVLPTGIDRYRARPEDAQAIAANRLSVISQFARAEPFSKERAYARNRTIVRLSRACIVIWSRNRRGTWNSAQVAIELGIPLFVWSNTHIPENARGDAPALIAQGAIPFASGAELEEQLWPRISHTQR